MKRLLACLVLVGCTPTTFVFNASMTGVSPKPDTCTFEVLTSPPSRDYEEVGTLALYDGPPPKTLAAFKQAVAHKVCRVGGDAAIAIADAKGLFTKGTVIAYTASGVSPPPLH